MNKNPANEKLHRLMVECDCACSALQIDYWDDGDGFVSLSHLVPSFYALQESSWDRFTKAIKIIWSIVRGKEYTFYEVIFQSRKEIREFKEFVAGIDENKVTYDE